MGLSPFSCTRSSPFSDKKSKIGFSCSRPDTSIVFTQGEIIDYGVNPDPRNFKVIWATAVNGNTIMMVNYPNCTTFGGNKLLLLRGVWPTTMSKLDPHFLEGDHPVVARFLPNKEGIKLAIITAHSL